MKAGKKRLVAMERFIKFKQVYRFVKNKVNQKKDKIQLVGLIITIVLGIVAIYLQINPPQTPQERLVSNLFFFVILFYVTLYFAVDWLSGKIKDYIDKINNHEEEIKEIKKRLDLETKLNEYDKRISLLEGLKKNKKGAIGIDPRIIILIILFILLYLYLRSLGVIS